MLLCVFSGQCSVVQRMDDKHIYIDNDIDMIQLDACMAYIVRCWPRRRRGKKRRGEKLKVEDLDTRIS